jgi:hypothetical protein
MLTGYVTDPSVTSRVFAFDFGGINAFDHDNQQLLAFSSANDGMNVTSFSGFPIEVAPNETGLLHLTTDSMRVAERGRFTAVRTSRRAERHYLLDHATQRILTIPRSFEQGTLKRIRETPIHLPAKVTLTPESRLCAMERDPRAPEKVDSVFYVSCPASHVVLEVEPTTGETKVFAGLPGTAGVPKEDSLATKTRFSAPSSLWFDYDDEGSRLLIVDQVTSEIYAIDVVTREVWVVATTRVGRAPRVVAELQDAVGVNVYRAEEHHVDAAALRPAGKIIDGWGVVPAVMIVWTSRGRVVGIPLNVLEADAITDFVPGVDEILTLPTGDLLACGGSRTLHISQPIAMKEILQPYETIST